MRDLLLSPCLAAVLLLVLLSGITAPLQAAVTGDLQVEVHDVDNGPLPGATVTIESTAQPGQRVATSQGKGEARFNMLAPGLYSVRVSMPGYATVVYDEVPVTVDETRVVLIVLPRRQEEVVKVIAEVPLVNVRSSKLGLSVRPELVDGTPTFNNFIARASMAAGVEYANNPQVHGARYSDNLYLVDGINTTDPVTGTWGTVIDYEAVQQHDVITAGHGPEYGSVVGMTSNLITKSGGNQMTGSLFSQYRDRGWYSGTDPGAVGSASSASYEYSATLGGPVVKDRLWWFASYRIYRLDTGTLVPEGTGPRPDMEYDADEAFGKLTWNITRNQQLVGQIANNDEVIYNYGASSITTARDQFAQQNQPQKNAALRHTATLGPNLMLQSQISFHRQDLDRVPQFPELGPNIQAIGSTEQFGRYSSSYVSDRDRDDFRSDLSWFLPTNHGDHNLRFGIQYQNTDYEYASTVSGDERFIELQAAGLNLWSLFGPGGGLLFRWFGLAEYNPSWECSLGGVPCSQQASSPSGFVDPADWQMIVDGAAYDPTDFTFDDPSINGSAADLGWVRHMRYATTDLGSIGSVGRRISALHAQDEWSLNRLAVTLGMRLERVELRDSHDEHFFTFDTTVAPRLGVSFDVLGDGRQKIFGHYGEYYDPIRDDLSSFTGQYGSPRNELQYWLSPAREYYTWFASGGEGSAGAVVAPAIKTPRTRMYVVGYAIDLGGNMALEVSALRHRTTDLVDDFDPIRAAPDPDRYPTLASGPTLESLGFQDRNGDGVVDPDDIDAPFAVYNPPGAVREYDGIDVVFTKRLANNWQMLASYSYADARGNQHTDSQAVAIGDDPYWDPRLPHNYGKLDFRDHTFKAYGSYRLPLDLEIGAAVTFRSGSHYGLGNIVTPEQGTGYWDGDPARIVDTLVIDRDVFSSYLGLPTDLEDGSRNPALDREIVGLMPLDLRAGRGGYENPSYYQLDLRLRYRFQAKHKAVYEAFLDVYNVLNRQEVATEDGRLATETGVAVTPENIADRSIYTFRQPLTSQSPRRMFLGFRASF